MTTDDAPTGRVSSPSSPGRRRHGHGLFLAAVGAVALAAAAAMAQPPAPVAPPPLASPRASSPEAPPGGVAARKHPAIFQAWNGIENEPDADELARLARHDLVFCGPYDMRLLWASTSDAPWPGLSTTLVGSDAGRVGGDTTGVRTARRRRETLRGLNPRITLLCELRYREGRYLQPVGPPDLSAQDAFPPDSPLWLRDAAGDLCPGWGEDADGDGTVERDEVRFMLVDFRRPELHDLIARKALAIQESGVFDGIMLDWWREDIATTGTWPAGPGTHLTIEEERAARLALLRAIRRVVRDDFLILVNSNDREVPLSAPLVNGLFMECWKQDRGAGYPRAAIAGFERTLAWAERSLRPPRINCLEGWRVVGDYTGDRGRRVAERDSPENRRWMRLFTTLSLTHSDGYVLFGDDNSLPSPDHLHNWYAFWDADLGPPVGPAAQRADGLFVREFTGGFAVYNRSGAPQTISVGGPTRSVAGDRVADAHVVADLDGDILLRAPHRPAEPPR